MDPCYLRYPKHFLHAEATCWVVSLLWNDFCIIIIVVVIVILTWFCLFSVPSSLSTPALENDCFDIS